MYIYIYKVVISVQVCLDVRSKSLNFDFGTRGNHGNAGVRDSKLSGSTFIGKNSKNRNLRPSVGIQQGFYEYPRHF